MSSKNNEKVITFPIKISETLSKQIDASVFIKNQFDLNGVKITKHDYILEAVKEKVEREQENTKKLMKEGI